MTVELEEFAEWRVSVEGRLCMLEAASDQHAVQISDQKGHLVSMDEDLTKIQVEFRAQRGMLQALHDTQSKHTAGIRKLRTGQEELRRGLTEVRGELTEVRGELTEVRVGIRTIIDLLNSADDDKNSGGSPN